MKKQYGLVNDEYIPPPRIQDAMSTLLASYGFKTMAEDVLTEDDPERLRQYARIIVKQTPEAQRTHVINCFRTLRMM